MKIANVALVFALSCVALSGAEATGKLKQKIVPPRPSTLTAQQQVEVVRQIVEAEPALKTFLARFPDTKLKASEERGGRHAASATVQVEGYLVNLRVSAQLDEKLASPTDVKRHSFTAVRVADVKSLKEGQVLAPIWMSFDRVEEFCADPLAVIASSPTRTGPNTFVPPKTGARVDDAPATP